MRSARRGWGFGAGLACVAALTTIAAANAQCDGEWLAGAGYPGANDTVYTTVIWNSGGNGSQPKVVFGGPFHAIAEAPQANGLAAWDPASGEWSGFGMGVEGFVFAATSTLDGDLVVAGTFSTAGGEPASRIARWDGKAWHTMAAGLNGTVYSLVTMPNGDIIAGGDFTRSGTTSCLRIARWDGTSWSGLGSGITLPAFGATVRALTVHNGDLIAAGAFTGAGGNPASNVARWDGSTWSALGAGVNGTVRSLLSLPTGELAVGGDFAMAGGSPASRIAVWNGSGWSGLGGGITGGNVGGMTLVDGNLLVCGSFTGAGGNPASRVASWNGSSWSPVGTGLGDGSGSDIVALPAGGFVIGGTFQSAGDVLTKNVARWDGSSWLPLTAAHAGFDLAVTGLAALSTGELVAGGAFQSYDGVAIDRVAKWDGLGWSQVSTGLDGTVRAMIGAPDDRVFFGGSFHRAGKEYCHYVAQWFPGTRLSRVGTENDANSDITSFAVAPSGDIIAGGNFTHIGSQDILHIARWDGSVWHPLGAGLASAPGAIAVRPNGDVVAGTNLWNGSTWTSLGSGSGSVHALLALSNGDVIAGGSFVTIGGVTAHRVARWDGLQWNAMGPGIDQGDVKSLLLLPSGEILAAGDFDEANGLRVNNIARWDGATWSPLGMGVNGQVNAMALLANGEVAIAGFFFSAGDHVSANFARWSPTGIPTILVQPAPQLVDPGQTVVLTAMPATGYSDVTVQWTRNGVAITNGAGGASPGGGTVTGASGSLESPTDGGVATLTISGAQSSDSGEYAAVFSNSCGDGSSVGVTVTIGLPCPADFNSDGTVNSTDVSDFINQWFQDQVDGTLITDWDHNGVVNSTDVSEFINTWFDNTAVGCGG